MPMHAYCASKLAFTTLKSAVAPSFVLLLMAAASDALHLATRGNTDAANVALSAHSFVLPAPNSVFHA